MTSRPPLAALILRNAIYQTLSVEERCLVALGEFEAAVNTLLDGDAVGLVLATASANRAMGPTLEGQRQSQRH